MAAISKKRLQSYFDKSERARKMANKGKHFEDLVCYLSKAVPGVSIRKRNKLNIYHSEEIDVGLWNERLPTGFHFLPNTILIEAKNWTSPVGSKEVASFLAKLEGRGLEFGFLIALNGVTHRALIFKRRGILFDKRSPKRFGSSLLKRAI
jgi:hypothetical protein